jgi:hypothetical protein
MRKALIAILFVAACGGSKPTTDDTTPPENEDTTDEDAATCEQAAINVVSELGDDANDDQKGRIQTVIVTSCHEDAWPQNAIDCATNSHGEELSRCDEFIPEDVGERVGQQITQILSEGGGAEAED